MMARTFALPLAGLLAAAALFRALQPSPPTPVRAEPALAAAPDAVPEPAPAPAPPPPAVPTAPAAFVEPVLAADELRPLLDARFSDETILAFARVSGRPFRPSPDELDSLRQAGMSDTLLGRLTGVPVTSEATSPAAPPVVHVTPVIHVYSPVTVTTVIEAPPPPPEPYISTVVLVPVGPPPLNAPLPPIYQKPSIFKTHEYMPTKPSPTAEEVARRDHARSTRIYR